MLFRSNNSNFNNNDNNNNYNNNDNNNYNNIEIIQEIQALGQSEMMVGKLDSAENYFLRQMEMCSKAVNNNNSASS